MQECKLEDCNQPITSRETGLCHKHHLRLIRYGTTKRSRELVDKSKSCSKEGCDRNSQTTKGLCLKHYKQWKRTQPEKRKCSLCDNSIKGGGGGLCSKHYNSKRRNGSATIVDVNQQRKLKPYGNQGFQYYKDADGRWTHRVVAEKIAGRKLRKGEVVHHINGDKLDNSEGNILLCESHSSHLSVHRQLESVAMQLVRDGYILFEDGCYKSVIE